MPQGRVRPETKRRKTCAVGKHDPLSMVTMFPLLLRCDTCDHFLGDERGLTNYGPDRPRLPAA